MIEKRRRRREEEKNDSRFSFHPLSLFSFSVLFPILFFFPSSYCLSAGSSFRLFFFPSLQFSDCQESQSRTTSHLKRFSYSSLSLSLFRHQSMGRPRMGIIHLSNFPSLSLSFFHSTIYFLFSRLTFPFFILWLLYCIQFEPVWIEKRKRWWWQRKKNDDDKERNSLTTFSKLSFSLIAPH